MKYIYLFILLIMLIPGVMAVNETAADIKFHMDFAPLEVTAVEVTPSGTMAFVGLSNGSIIAMDGDGDVLYNLFVQEGPKVIDSDNSGNIVFLSPDPYNYVGYVRYDGVLTYSVGSSSNISTVEIGNNGVWFMQANNIPGTSGVYIRESDGDVIYSNTSATANWNTAAFDSVNNLIVAGNNTNNSAYLWNITNWTGWHYFNTAHTSTKNASQVIIDQFPLRYNISISNGASASVSLGFTPNTSATSYCNITKKSAAEFWYNTSCGHYFLWTNGNNISSVNEQSILLNHSYYNTTSGVYNVTFKPSSLIQNMTMYYGYPPYTNQITDNNWTTNSGVPTIVNFTGTSTWTAPAGVTAVNMTLVGAGGGGGSGSYYSSGGRGGAGGTNGTTTWYNNIAVVPGTNYPITVGTGGSANGTGGTSYFNGSQSAPGGPGGANGAMVNPFGQAGDNGNTTAYYSYPTATSGSEAYVSSPCVYSYGNAAGGAGYGAGGGGGAGEGTDGCSSGHPGAGGAGANGLVQISYYSNNVTKYLVGTAPTSSTFSSQMNETVSTALNYVTQVLLTGNIQSMSIPEAGGFVSIGTSGPNVYNQEILQTGFGTQYSGAAEAGTSNDISVSDSASYILEARASGVDIYGLDGTQLGHYATGGTVNAVDISEVNGLYAIAGSNDGKDYIFAKDTSSGWLLYYYSDTDSTVSSVAMAARGELACSGRSSGLFTCYDLFTVPSAAATTFTVDIFVHKGGSAYSGVNMSVQSGETFINGTTDDDGKFSFTATDQTQYTIVVGDNEYTGVYSASSNYRIATINIANPLITKPFEYYAHYNATDHKISYYYHDVDLADVNVQIYDNVLKTNVVDIDYMSIYTVDANYTILNTNHSYKVKFDFTRSPTGARYQDTINIQPKAGVGGAFADLPDDYKLFATFIYIFIVLGGFALTVSKTSIKPGMLMLVGLWTLGGYIGIIPFNWENPEFLAVSGTIYLIAIATLLRRGD